MPIKHRPLSLGSAHSSPSFSTTTTMSLSLLLSFSLLLSVSSAAPPPMNLTIVNNCPFPIWPALQPNSGHPVLERGGFFLEKFNHRSFLAPTRPWSGRIWARTYCSHTPHGSFSCATGDCNGRLECNGLGGAPPASLAQIGIHHGGARDFTSYGVSLVDGYNVPMTVTPHEGHGNCPVVGCKEDLLPTCPAGLQVRAQHGGHIIGCKSGCQAHPQLDELCCRGHFNSPQTCKPSVYSDYFKHRCPATFTYAHDSPSLTHECSSPRELKVIFCH